MALLLNLPFDTRLSVAGTESWTPSVVLAELSDIFRRRGYSEAWKSTFRLLIQTMSEVVPLDADIADLAGDIKQELRNSAHGKKAGLIDATVLAHGKSLGTKVLTGGEHLIGRKDVINVKEGKGIP